MHYYGNKEEYTERTRRIQFKDKEKIEQYKNAYMKFRNDVNKNPNSLDFYTLMFFAFSQQFRFNKNGEFNMPFGNDCFSEKNIEYIKNGCNFFQNNQCKTSNNDFKTLIYNIISITTDNNFYYFDPPYFITMAEYNDGKRGLEGWNANKECELLSFLEKIDKSGRKFMLSNVLTHKGKEHRILKEWAISHNFYINKIGETGIKYPRTEVLITNYAELKEFL